MNVRLNDHPVSAFSSSLTLDPLTAVVDSINCAAFRSGEPPTYVRSVFSATVDHALACVSVDAIQIPIATAMAPIARPTPNGSATISAADAPAEIGLTVMVAAARVGVVR